MDALSAHVGSILTRQPKVELLTRQLVSLPTGPRAEEVLSLYEAEFGRAMQTAKVSRGVLYGFCALLLGIVAYTLYALRTANAHLKGQTRDLSAAVAGLEREMMDRKRAETELHKAHKELLEASRLAGMAEVATGVLHNVGNVLNSVNVGVSCLAAGLRKSKAGSISRIAALLREHEADLGAFLTSDPKGRQLPGYLEQLSEHLDGEQAAALKELSQVQKHVEHIKDIVAMQQSYAKVSGVTETLHLRDLVEDALLINASALSRHDIQVARDYAEVPLVTIEKHKVLQILVNLVRNAKHACVESGRATKRLTVRVAADEGLVKVAVTDDGIGIPAENLTRIFNHGFTTRKHGHGFGLHSGALAAKEMGGSLTVESAGVGQGATFTLELPLHPGSRSVTPATLALHLAP